VAEDVPTNFATVWEGIARAQPDLDCQVHGDRRLTWSEVDRRADAVADALLASGLGQQDKVAQYLYNCPEYLESVWACFKVGLVPVNTNYRYRGDELVYLWSNAEVKIVVFHARFAETIESIRTRLPGIECWLCVSDGIGAPPTWSEPYERAASAPGPQGVSAPWGRTPDDIYLLYTGGTTGLPKGVMWRQADVFNYFDSVTPAPTDHAERPAPPVHLPACPLMHGTGFVTSLRAMSNGGSIVTLGSTSFDVDELLDTIERERVTTLAIVGDTFGKPMLQALDRKPERWDISSLRVVTSSGVMWSAESKQGLLRHNPTMVLFDSLGSAEAMGLATSVTTTGGTASATASFQISGNTRVIADDGRFVEPGTDEIGMLAVRGFMPIGYYKDAKKTMATFRVVDGVRWSIPGDYAKVELDGTVTFLGRGSTCINTGGEKVFPEEVEEALKLHPTVADAVVVGVPDERFGESIHAVIEPAPGADVDEQALIAHVKERLAGYKSPRSVRAVPSIERASNGKVDYRRWQQHVRTAAHVDDEDQRKDMS
jgi:acyl-CoA synthetase (AMP-forming)/AMP-acid ligase II